MSVSLSLKAKRRLEMDPPSYTVTAATGTPTERGGRKRRRLSSVSTDDGRGKKLSL